MSDTPDDPSDPPHPDCILRIASAVHRFRVPYINPNDQLSLEESFKTCSRNHGETVAVLRQADTRRDEVKQAMAAGRMSHQTLSDAVDEYIPLINQVLFTCKVQPEVARLDKRLIFSWSSGLEHSKTPTNFLDSEALMFELVLSLATYALSFSNLGCDSCVDGDFPSASRHFAKAAGVFKILGEDQLPSWMAKSQQHSEMEKEALAETRVGVCVAFTTYFTGVGQQMAVSTLLVKQGIPNYALVGKLCMGIAEEFESFVSMLRSKASVHMSRLDPAFLTLITFQINVQRALSLYFLARSLWSSKGDYGCAIAALSEATVAMRTRTSPAGRGLPEIESTKSLQSLVAEVADFRHHMAALLQSWERDNSLVYFDRVPPSVPASKGLKAIRLNKVENYTLDARDPLPLSIPGSSGDGGLPPSYDAAMMAGQVLTRTDSDLARELDAKLNS